MRKCDNNRRTSIVPTRDSLFLFFFLVLSGFCVGVRVGRFHSHLLCCLQLMFFGVSTWLWFLFGLFGQDVSMPRAEHRAMAARLDKVKLKPKEMRRGVGGGLLGSAAAGRQHLAAGPHGGGAGDEDSQLEKMLGYN